MEKRRWRPGREKFASTSKVVSPRRSLRSKASAPATVEHPSPGRQPANSTRTCSPRRAFGANRSLIRLMVLDLAILSSTRGSSAAEENSVTAESVLRILKCSSALAYLIGSSLVRLPSRRIASKYFPISSYSRDDVENGAGK